MSAHLTSFSKIINKFTYRSETTKGFTLVELLVVISIIAILVTVGSSIYTNATMSARDTKRIADLKDISNYLLLYYKQNGKFPDSTAEAGCSGWEEGNASEDGFNELGAKLTDAGILDRPLPVEKRLTTCTYKYKKCSPDGSAVYAILYADLETDSGEADVRPTVAGGDCWGNEADPGTAQDKKDWAIFLLE